MKKSVLEILRDLENKIKDSQLNKELIVLGLIYAQILENTLRELLIYYCNDGKCKETIEEDSAGRVFEKLKKHLEDNKYKEFLIVTKITIEKRNNFIHDLFKDENFKKLIEFSYQDLKNFLLGNFSFSFFSKKEIRDIILEWFIQFYAFKQVYEETFRNTL